MLSTIKFVSGEILAIILSSPFLLHCCSSSSLHKDCEISFHAQFHPTCLLPLYSQLLHLHCLKFKKAFVPDTFLHSAKQIFFKKSRLSLTTSLKLVESSISYSLRRCLQAFKIPDECKIPINFTKILIHLTFLDWCFAVDRSPFISTHNFHEISFSSLQSGPQDISSPFCYLFNTLHQSPFPFISPCQATVSNSRHLFKNL